MNIVFYEPEIPQNTGTTGRLCAATNTVFHLVGRLGFSLDEKRVKRAGLDYWPYLDLRLYDTWEEFKEKNPGRYIMFTVHTDKLYTEIEYRENDYLVFGRETKGLPKEWLKDNPLAVTIPMFNKNVRSLNLATTSGIALYEALRQVRFSK